MQSRAGERTRTARRGDGVDPCRQDPCEPPLALELLEREAEVASLSLRSGALLSVYWRRLPLITTEKAASRQMAPMCRVLITTSHLMEVVHGREAAPDCIERWLRDQPLTGHWAGDPPTMLCAIGSHMSTERNAYVRAQIRRSRGSVECTRANVSRSADTRIDTAICDCADREGTLDGKHWHSGAYSTSAVAHDFFVECRALTGRFAISYLE